MENELFENGDPWDHILHLTATVERLIVAHNNLISDFQKISKKQKITDAQLQEIRRLLIDEGYSLDNIQRTK